MPTDVSVTLPLNHLDELFNAPDANPFSTHEVDILGESGMVIIKKRVTRFWPRRPESVHVTLQLPAEEITPDLTEKTNTAVRRYCSDRIANNRLQRGLVNQRSRRQFTGAIIGTLISLVLIAILYANPLGLLPELVQGILIVFASFAIAILIFNALWSLVFDWLPFVQDNTVHTVLQGMELTIEPLPVEQASS
jgi:hypothetical protein